MTVERQVAALDGLALVCIFSYAAFPFFNLAVVGHTSAGRSLAPLWDRHQVTQAISLRYGYRPRELTLQV